MLRLSKKNRLAASFILLLFLGLLASTMIAYQHVKIKQQQAIYNDIQLKAKLVSSEFNHWVKQSLDQIEHFAIFLSLSPEPLQEYSNFQRYIAQHPKRGGLEYLGYALESDGYYGITDWQVPSGYDPRQRPWYIEGKKAHKPVIGHPYLSVEGTPRLLLAVTAPIIARGRFKGLASAHIDLDYVQTSLEKIDLGRKGYAYWIDAEGKPIVQGSNQLQKLSLPSLPNVASDKGNTHGLMSQIETASQLIFVSNPDPELGWQLIFAVPKEVIAQELLQGIANLLGQFLIVFMLVVFGLYLANRHLFTPLFDFLELDSVTLLPGKKHFKQQLLDDFLLPGKKGKLLIINMDSFSRITATYPAAHIHLLQNQIKKRIQSQLCNKALLGSFSESRYIAYCDCEISQQCCDKLLVNLSNVLGKHYKIAGEEIGCSFRIGASFYPEHGADVEILIDNAFSALSNVARNQSKNYSIFTPIFNRQFSDEQFLHNAIKKAIQTAEFSMVYQPQVDTKTGRSFAIESLIRWHSTELGRTVSPGEFIPVAESCGLMVPLGGLHFRYCV